MQLTNDLIGQFLTFTFKGNRLAVSGILEVFNNEWILIRYYFDYRHDGYSLFRNKNVKYIHGCYEETATKILKIKEGSSIKQLNFKIGTIDSMLRNVTRNYGLILLNDKMGMTSRMLRYISKEGTIYRFQEYDVNAIKLEQIFINEKEIDHVCFDNDYLTSLQLIIKK